MPRQVRPRLSRLQGRHDRRQRPSVTHTLRRGAGTATTMELAERPVLARRRYELLALQALSRARVADIADLVKRPPMGSPRTCVAGAASAVRSRRRWGAPPTFNRNERLRVGDAL